MNAITTLDRIRDLVQSKMLELQPYAGEEMNLEQTDPHRDGFVAGERALAGQIMKLLDGPLDYGVEENEPMEEEMVMSLGRT